MNKRQAIAVAAGLVMAMMGGVVALSLGRGIVGTNGAGASTTLAPKPIVKTVTQVITVKKRLPSHGVPARTITVVRQAPASVAPGSTSSYHDDRNDGIDDSARKHQEEGSSGD